MMFEEPNRQEYPLLKMPVLLIIGESDRSVFFRRYASPEAIKPLGNWPELGRHALKDLSDGKLVEIVGAGHVSHVEKFDEFEAVRWMLFSPPGFTDGASGVTASGCASLKYWNTAVRDQAGSAVRDSHGLCFSFCICQCRNFIRFMALKTNPARVAAEI
jgi:hypothetical protein